MAKAEEGEEVTVECPRCHSQQVLDADVLPVFWCCGIGFQVIESVAVPFNPYQPEQMAEDD